MLTDEQRNECAKELWDFLFDKLTSDDSLLEDEHPERLVAITGVLVSILNISTFR